MNGITRLPPIVETKLNNTDIRNMLFVLAGAKVSNMPEGYTSKIYTDKCEVFDPEKATNPEELPNYWKMVWDLHNTPNMGDCRRFHYRYVHIPYDVIPRYPRVPCKGIFCISDDKVNIDKLTTDDLIHIGNEFE